ncbi:MAG: SIMPL domain-containing protein, partial [Sphingomicrobium sp.]
MKHAITAALLLGAAGFAAPAAAQPASAITQAISGTRLDLSATGDVTQVPDLALITAGVVTKGSTAGSALSQTAQRMERVRAALKAAGIADRDIQTSNISLNPEYSYDNNVQR